MKYNCGLRKMGGNGLKFDDDFSGMLEKIFLILPRVPKLSNFSDNVKIVRQLKRNLLSICQSRHSVHESLVSEALPLYKKISQSCKLVPTQFSFVTLSFIKEVSLDRIELNVPPRLKMFQCGHARLASCVIVLSLSMFLLFVPYTIDSKATVFTKLGAALWAGMNDILEPIQYEWYPHTAVAPEKNISKSQFLANSKLNSRIKQNMARRICSLLVFTLDQL